MTDDDDLTRNLARARRMTWTAVGVAYGVAAIPVALAALLVAGPLLVLVVIVAVIAVVALVGTKLPAVVAPVVLQAAGARPLAAGEEPRLDNVVEGLCVSTGLQAPRTWVVDDERPNALVVARSVDDADLVVTRGLLGTLTLIELEAVVAHELARVRRGEAVVGTLAGPLLGGRRPGQPVPPGLLLPVLAAPLTRAVASRGPRVEDWPDLAAVEITRYPPGLAGALEEVGDEADAVPPSGRPWAEHLWLAGPEPSAPFADALASVYAVRRPLADRIEMLQEL